MSAPDSCGSCGAKIRWAKTETGKAMPIDWVPAAGGNVQSRTVNGVTTAHVLSAGEEPNPWWPRFTSHFSTCPDAGQHRKRGAK